MKVALLSDIHANIFALEAVLEDLRRENIDRILVAGDLVGYYYWPKEVVGLLKGDSRVSCIRGNHEVILGEVLASPDAAIRYRSKYGSGYEVCRETLSADELRWLVTLPESLTVDIDGCSFHVAHGSLSSADEYLYPDAGAELLEQYGDGLRPYALSFPARQGRTASDQSRFCRTAPRCGGHGKLRHREYRKPYGSV